MEQSRPGPALIAAPDDGGDRRCEEPGSVVVDETGEPAEHDQAAAIETGQRIDLDHPGNGSLPGHSVEVGSDVEGGRDCVAYGAELSTHGGRGSGLAHRSRHHVGELVGNVGNLLVRPVADHQRLDAGIDAGRQIHGGSEGVEGADGEPCLTQGAPARLVEGDLVAAPDIAAEVRSRRDRPDGGSCDPVGHQVVACLVGCHRPEHRDTRPGRVLESRRWSRTHSRRWCRAIGRRWSAGTPRRWRGAAHRSSAGRSACRRAHSRWSTGSNRPNR